MIKVLEQARATLETYKNAGGEKPATADAMFEALAVTLHASEYDNDTRLECLSKLLMKCTTEWSRKQLVVDYTVALIAADYYFSLGKLRAIPFLNRALESYAQVLESTAQNPIDNADRFLGQFRARNLRGKFKRELLAVKNISTLSGASKKLGLEMSELDELPADYVPFLSSWHGFPFILLLGVVGALMVMNELNEYRVARMAGTPIPLMDALQPGEIPVMLIGLLLVIAEFFLLFWQFRPSYNRMISKYYYWKFSRKH